EAVQEAFHPLAQGELDVEHAAMAKHQAKEAQAAAGGADLHVARAAPVDLDALAGGEGECQVGRLDHRTDLANVFFDDAVTAGVAFPAQPLKDLRRRVAMVIEPAGDQPFVRVELAGAAAAAAGPVALLLEPARDGPLVEAGLRGDPGDAQALL